jgi:hypothetical protein
MLAGQADSARFESRDGIDVASRAQKTGNSAERAIPIHD